VNAAVRKRHVFVKELAMNVDHGMIIRAALCTPRSEEAVVYQVLIGRVQIVKYFVRRAKFLPPDVVGRRPGSSLRRTA